MTGNSGPSKLSPWIYLGALGSLSLASIFFTYENESLPGVVTPDRTPVSSSVLRQIQEDLQESLKGVSDWSQYCQEPQTLLGQLSFAEGHKLVAFTKGEHLWELPQRERDAWSRCQPSPSISEGFRQHYCFHFSGGKEGNLPWSSRLNLLEMNFELHKRGSKSPLRCSDIAAGKIPEELVVYYSAYWSERKKGKIWQFERLAGGFRFPVQWQARQASAK